MSDLRGKRALVTGASSGIGFATACELARMGAEVVVHSRTEAKGEETRARIAAETGNDRTEVLVSDFTDLFSVCTAADEFIKRFDRLDILILNAAAIYPERRVSEHGNELTFQVNHLAHFMLWRVLQPILWASAPSRIVHVSSDAHFATRKGLNFDDLMGEQEWSPFSAYAQSKLANIMFCYAQARKLGPMGVTCNVVHPGMVRTGFGSEGYGWFGKLISAVAPMLRQTPEAAADTIVWLATSPEVEGVTGKYFYKRRPHRSSPASHDEAAQMRLWDISRDLAGCGCLKCPQSE